MSVVIETTLGDITVDLYVTERPQTCMNFLKLCKLKYYNLNLFHSVNSNFCAQTGDPTGKGDGGESIHGLLKGEKFRFYQGETQPKMKHDRAGLVSMVSHGDGMLGSQFIITLSPDLGSLDSEHCVFGQVVDGSDVLLKLNEAITDEKHRPYQDIRITHTVVLEDPFPDPAGMLDPPMSPLPPSTRDAAYSRIPADEPLTETYTQDELNEMVQAREAAARATILEMVGDLPSADLAPPENVLFVCKLNPVTTEHDLSLIFSRFGKVKNCEVIKDAVTGDSLQYAFVEFEDKQSCERAYFKMDNVLIDERRIHVDFSQSVAKWRGKGKGVEMLVPPPPGGWGNKSRTIRNNIDRNAGKDKGSRPRGDDNGRPSERDDNGGKREEDIRRGKGGGVRDRGDSRRDHREKEKEKDRRVPIKAERSPDKGLKNGRSADPPKKNKVVVKKEITKKRKHRSPSSSSSESTSDSSSSSESSSDSEPPKKKSRNRKTDKVLVVVKTPRGKKSKKKRKTKKKSKRSSSESEEDVRTKKKRKARKKASRESSSSSSDHAYSKKKKKRKEYVSDDEDRKRKRRKKVSTSESSSGSSDEEAVKKPKKKTNTRSKGHESSSDADAKKKKKKTKRDVKSRVVVKKRKTQSSSDSDSSSSSESD